MNTFALVLVNLALSDLAASALLQHRAIQVVRTGYGIALYDDRFARFDRHPNPALRRLFCNDLVRTVVSVDLRRSETSDLAFLVAHLPNIRRLALDPRHATTAGFAHVARLRHLEELTVEGRCALGDEAIALIAQPNLQVLEVASPKLTDAALANLGRLPRLRVLKLSDVWHPLRTEVTDRGLAHLKNLPLEVLWLGLGAYSDDGLRNMAPQPRLAQLLVMVRPDFSDKGFSLPAIRLFPALKSGLAGSILLTPDGPVPAIEYAEKRLRWQSPR